MSTAERVRQKLIKTGATQVQIAASTGIGQASVSRFLRGQGDAKVTVVDKMEAFADQQLEIIKRAKRAELRVKDAG